MIILHNVALSCLKSYNIVSVSLSHGCIYPRSSTGGCIWPSNIFHTSLYYRKYLIFTCKSNHKFKMFIRNIYKKQIYTCTHNILHCFPWVGGRVCVNKGKSLDRGTKFRAWWVWGVSPSLC